MSKRCPSPSFARKRVAIGLLFSCLLTSARVFAQTAPAHSDSGTPSLNTSPLFSLWSGQASFVLDASDVVSTDSGRQITHASIISVDSEFYAYSTEHLTDDDNSSDNDRFGVRLFVSSNGLRWKDEGMVLTPKPGTYYEQICSFPGVLKIESTYYMVFEAKKLNATADIGLATSSDGIHWTVTDEPILKHTGAGFERANIGTPSLYFSERSFTLFYHAYDHNDCRLFAAVGPSLFCLSRVNDGRPLLDTSKSGIDSGTIGKRSKIFAEGGYYYMVIEVSSDQVPEKGYGGSNWSTMLVRSRSPTDGWEKLPDTILPKTGSGFGFDGPELVRINESLRIFTRDKKGATRTAALRKR